MSLHREGLQEYLNVYSDREKFKELTGIQIVDDLPKPEEPKISESSSIEELKDFVKLSQPDPPSSLEQKYETDLNLELKLTKEMLAEIQSSSLQSTSFQSFTSPAPIPNPFISSDSPSQTPVISSAEPTDPKIENSTEDPSTTDQMLYEESLNLALKESMNEAKVEQKTEIIEVLENTEDKVEDTAADLFGNDLFEEEEEKLVEGVTDEQRKEVKKRMMSQRKLKKMQAKNYAAEYKTQAYKDNLMYSSKDFLIKFV